MKAPVRSPLACEANVSGEGWSPRARVVCEPSGATKMTLERFASILELNRSLTDISGPRRTSRSPGVADNRTACAQAGNGSPSNIVASTMTLRPVRIPNQYMPTNAQNSYALTAMRKLPCLPRRRARLRHQHQRAARKCELPPQFVDHIHLRGVRPGIQLG